MADIGQAVTAINALIRALGIPEDQQSAYRDMLFRMGDLEALTLRYDMRPAPKLNGFSENDFADLVATSPLTGPVSWPDWVEMAGGVRGSKDVPKVTRIGKKAIEHGLCPRLDVTPTKRGSMVLLPRE